MDSEIDLSPEHAKLPNVQWKCSPASLREIEEFLEPFETRMQRGPKDTLMIQAAWTGMNIVLNPGDCLILNGNSLGIVRVPHEQPN